MSKPIWGITDKRSLNVIKHLEMMGYTVVQDVPTGNVKVVLFIKEGELLSELSILVPIEDLNKDFVIEDIVKSINHAITEQGAIS